jgi:hypothetical protein
MRWLERRNRMPEPPMDAEPDSNTPQGTFIRKDNAAWLKSQVGSQIPIEIWVWRSAGVRFLRTFFHDGKGGRLWLRVLYWLEERFPHFFGEKGQYPLIVMKKGKTPIPPGPPSPREGGK